MTRRLMLACAALVLLLLVLIACTVVRVTTFYPRCSGDGKGCTYRQSHYFHSPEPTMRILWLPLPTGPLYLCEWRTLPRYDGTLAHCFRIQLPSGPVVLYPWRHD